MLESIQDYAKKINRELTFVDCASILATLLVLLGFFGYLSVKETKTSKGITYSTNSAIDNLEEVQPFASRNGKTYTFSWCGGSSAIKDSNKIYFKTEEQAKASGRTLSKLCSR